MGTAFKSVDQALGAGAGTSIDFGDVLENFAVHVIVTGGTVSALSIQLEGGLDGVTYTKIGAPIVVAGDSYTSFAGPARNVRATINSMVVLAGAPKVTIFIGAT